MCRTFRYLYVQVTWAFRRHSVQVILWVDYFSDYTDSMRVITSSFLYIWRELCKWYGCSSFFKAEQLRGIWVTSGNVLSLQRKQAFYLLINYKYTCQSLSNENISKRFFFQKVARTSDAKTNVFSKLYILTWSPFPVYNDRCIINS